MSNKSSFAEKMELCAKPSIEQKKQVNYITHLSNYMTFAGAAAAH